MTPERHHDKHDDDDPYRKAPERDYRESEQHDEHPWSSRALYHCLSLTGEHVSFLHEEWQAFVAGVRGGEFESTALLAQPAAEQEGDSA
jgi:hypothetical protein